MLALGIKGKTQMLRAYFNFIVTSEGERRQDQIDDMVRPDT